MLLLTKIMHEVELRLKKLCDDKKLMDYKLSLELNLSIVVYIRVNDDQEFFDFKAAFTDEQNAVMNITLITDEKAEYIDFTEKIDMHKRRRLGGLIEPKNLANNPCPVFCFYSYKGGVGRTTTLAAFATYLAKVEQKKVVIIDCDFEAPGITNYFDLDLDRVIDENEDFTKYKTNFKSGIVEYFLDQPILKKQGKRIDLINDYLHHVGSEYTSGAGSIDLLAAGNLDYHNDETGKSHREQYLEALARIDTYGNYGANQFKTLFEDLAKAIDFDYENGVILIDSRTGFNDTFATISSVSDTIVGFFGNNLQTQPGLHQFLEMFGKRSEHSKFIILANSIVASKKHCENIFKPNIQAFINQYPEKFEYENLGFLPFHNYAFPVTRENETLANIGIKALESKEVIDKTKPDRMVNKDFIDLVTKDNHFNGLFHDDNGLVAILKNIVEIKKKIDNKKNIDNNNTTDSVEEDTAIIIATNENGPITDFLGSIKNKVSRKTVRENLLSSLHNDKMLFPINNTYAYAEDMTDMQPENFFFRNCMRDIFNNDKFIITGYKGMGKTQLYQSFKYPAITEQLCKRAGKDKNNYLFINVIPVYNVKEIGKDFNFNQAFQFSEIPDKDWFFSRLWQLLTYQAIRENSWIKQNYIPKNDIILPEINTSNRTRIELFIKNNENMDAIATEIRHIDLFVKENNKYLIVAYDQLDYIVKPQFWADGVAPLIDFWRGRPYSNITPKIFLRTDLYDRMTNLTNKHQLGVTDLKWEKTEIFGLIFKIIFVSAKFDFYKLIYSYNDYSESIKQKIIDIDALLDDTQQFKTENEDLIKFLVENFFGQSANINDIHQQTGTAYDWFFNNLSDAKGILCVRPLLDLLKKAINKAEEYGNKDNEWSKKHKPILSGLYFSNNEVRADAVAQYYIDLAQDTENQELLLIKEYYIDKCPRNLKTYTVSLFNLNKILKGVISTYQNDYRLNKKTEIELINLLLHNGIIKPTETNKTIYEFPYLYRLFFKLKNYNEITEM